VSLSFRCDVLNETQMIYRVQYTTIWDQIFKIQGFATVNEFIITSHDSVPVFGLYASCSSHEWYLVFSVFLLKFLLIISIPENVIHSVS